MSSTRWMPWIRYPASSAQCSVAIVAVSKAEWLAGHLGDTYAETSEGGLRIATYTPSDEDHTTIYVELANQTYLDAPRPGG